MQVIKDGNRLKITKDGEKYFLILKAKTLNFIPEVSLDFGDRLITEFEEADLEQVEQYFKIVDK